MNYDPIFQRKGRTSLFHAFVINGVFIAIQWYAFKDYSDNHDPSFYDTFRTDRFITLGVALISLFTVLIFKLIKNKTNELLLLEELDLEDTNHSLKVIIRRGLQTICYGDWIHELLFLISKPFVEVPKKLNEQLQRIKKFISGSKTEPVIDVQQRVYGHLEPIWEDEPSFNEFRTDMKLLIQRGWVNFISFALSVFATYFLIGSYWSGDIYDRIDHTALIRAYIVLAVIYNIWLFSGWASALLVLCLISYRFGRIEKFGKIAIKKIKPLLVVAFSDISEDEVMKKPYAQGLGKLPKRNDPEIGRFSLTRFKRSTNKIFDFILLVNIMVLVVIFYLAFTKYFFDEVLDVTVFEPFETISWFIIFALILFVVSIFTYPLWKIGGLLRYERYNIIDICDELYIQKKYKLTHPDTDTQEKEKIALELQILSKKLDRLENITEWPTSVKYLVAFLALILPVVAGILNAVIPYLIERF
ncbi:MAG: hypothetical protein ACXAD7_14755 [Candidatus Kariarchaeaceae archaeon]